MTEPTSRLRSRGGSESGGSASGGVILLAFGPAKVHAVTQMVEGPQAAICPASLLQSHPQATIVLDEGSAAGLGSAGRHRRIHENELSQRRQD